MNPYVTLLKRCGRTVVPGDRGWHVSGHSDILTDDELKAYALEVGAKDAAGWLSDEHCLVFERDEDGNWDGWLPDDDELSLVSISCLDLELIRIATKAGWVKGEGL